VDQIQRQQLKEALIQVAMLESKNLAVKIAEIIAHLQKQDYLTALGSMDGIEDQVHFLSVTLSRARTQK
jgi:hypothetical protein